MVTRIQIPEAIVDLRAGDELILRFRTWDDYEALLDRRFPNIDLKTLIPQYCDRGGQVGSSTALREFESITIPGLSIIGEFVLLPWRSN
ncbi:MAG TPA: hypothetical protein IGS17_16510 [Oscillatoriales cyanobacterium M59_W2019_021]|nr:MAG: hypothetical protein D6728_19355 [Cyanobacteria bacterium J055]HIK52508.1 hypothetical protein [Oscillatoriales cyanobacterium M59_W2019_021]